VVPPRRGCGRAGGLAGGGEVGSRPVAWLGVLGIGKRKRLDGLAGHIQNFRP
jgi:hypothetical protein